MRRVARVITLGFTVAGACCACWAGSALAGASTVTIGTPANARPNIPYEITLKGFATRKELLVALWSTTQSRPHCASTPAGELLGGFEASPTVYEVRGRFTKRSSQQDGQPGTDILCAYLVNRATDAVLARASATYEIH